MSNESCQDIREYLLTNHSDITLQPVTIIIFVFLYSLIIIVGVVGNMLVVISVCQHRALQSVRNVFIVSLSCSDIVVSLVSASVTPITAFSKVWLFGVHLCHLLPLIQGTSLCFSTLTLTAIAIDRFILIVFPTKKPIQKTHAFRMIFFNSTLALALSVPMFIKQKLEPFQNFCGEFCSETWEVDSMERSIYGTLVFFIQFIFPFVVIAFCYTAISIKLRRGILVRANSQQPMLTEQRKAALKRRIRTNRMLIAMVGVFFCCWLPSVVFNFLRDYNLLPAFVTRQGYLFGLITHCISMSSTVWNPCLYTLCNEQFRAAFTIFLQYMRRTEKKITFNNIRRKFGSAVDSTVS
ncbi:unnamed protein product [Caenorhabditis auriculariae]|uniref:G-protein coupled receptors family 1 profile domain-containing protein n=1 Tax=Caenorhabditis auriculariae TaxID=2777116 RepID=A0A8S1H6Z1_9PELO|nr:unnamed protein product [Caenorhabditis auriculariae]